MRTGLVQTHFTCNQACTHCATRRPRDDAAFVGTAAVLRRTSTQLERGATEVLFSGGEPTMRSDLARLVAHARSRGAERVRILTNATLLDDARAAELAASGLTGATVKLCGFDDAVDAITLDPGGFDRTRAGLRALLAHGVRVEVQADVVVDSVPLLPALPRALAREFGDDPHFAGLLVGVPADGPAPERLVSYEQAVPVVLAMASAARSVGMPIRLTNDALPACVFPPDFRATHLFALSPGGSERHGFAHADACASCQVRARCPGLSCAYVARHGAPKMQPVTDDRLRRRLSVVSPPTEQASEAFVEKHCVSTTAGPVVEHLIRINFNCNQNCRFCFVPTHLPGAGDRAVRREIEAAAAAGATIVFTGGEPTLNPHVVDYVRLAKSLGVSRIGMQTNATRFGDEKLATDLAEAGLSAALVSLHGHTAEISDAITDAPGTYDETVRGIDRLLAAGVFVNMSHVVCQRNWRHVVPFVQMVAQRWPSVHLRVYFVEASSELVPRDAQLVPRYSDVQAPLEQAFAEAARLGFSQMDLEMRGGVPLCLAPESARRAFVERSSPVNFGGRGFVRTAACDACGVRQLCPGLHEGYFEIHGGDELRPLPG